ncbi:MAG: type IV pilus secretin PilQ [Deltaproteobacteria bacterium]|nr:type IV pilus secretin PilQ [Deltaproteobacteria bacterium]
MRISSLQAILFSAVLVLTPGLLPAPVLAGAAAADPENDAPILAVLKTFPASMRTENLQVSLLLRGMGRQAGINIMVADNITDTINLDVEKLSLYEVFQVIMDAKQLRYYQKNNVLFVEKKADFQGQQRDLASERLCTKFGNAAAYIDQMKPLLSPNGSITLTSRGNCLFIQDRAGNIPRLREMLVELDQPIPQVHIEARIVSISNEAKKQLGIIWGYNNYRDAAALATKINPITTSINLPAAAPTTSLAFGFIRQNINLNMELQAMQSDSLLEILSSPSVLVLDGKEAEIKQGKEIPYVTGGTTVTPSNTSFREANLGLKVKPTVLQDGYVILDVGVTNDSVDQTTTSTSGLLINKQSITTNLLLEDKVTVVIGGIVQQNKSNQNSKVPGLGDIPLFGNLFKNSNKRNDQTELMVFITPRIVSMTPKPNDEATAKEPAPSEAPAKNHKEEALPADDPTKTTQGAAAPPQ